MGIYVWDYEIQNKNDSTRGFNNVHLNLDWITHNCVINSKSFHLFVCWELYCILYSDGSSLLRLKLQSPLYVVLSIQLRVRRRSILLLFRYNWLCQCHL